MTWSALAMVSALTPTPITFTRGGASSSSSGGATAARSASSRGNTMGPSGEIQPGPGANEQALLDLSLDPVVRAREPFLQGDLRLPMQHLPQARVVRIAAPNPLRPGHVP